MSHGPYSPLPDRRHHPAPGFENGHARASQQHFDPPPTSAYEDYDPPRNVHPEDRPYAPADPRSHSFNQITPYYDETLEAGSARSWDEQQAYTHRLPPPPSDYDLGRKPRPPAGGHFHDKRGYNDSYDDSRSFDSRYDDDRRSYDSSLDRRRPYEDRFDDRRSYDGRYVDARSDASRNREDRSRHRRRRSAEDDVKKKRDFLGGAEGERGVAAKLIGGAGGAILGQTFGRGHTLETIAGAAVGAIAATAIEKQIEKRKEDKIVVRRSRDGSAALPASSYKQPGRDTRDVRETARNGSKPGLRERLRSLSRRGTRSLSRQRPREDRRRRSDSYGSMDSMRRESSR